MIAQNGGLYYASDVIAGVSREALLLAASGGAGRIIGAGVGAYGVGAVWAARGFQVGLLARDAYMTGESAVRTYEAYQQGDRWGTVVNGVFTGLGVLGTFASGRQLFSRSFVAPRGAGLSEKVALEFESRGSSLGRLRDSQITRKSQLIRELEGTTPEAAEIADAIRSGDINVRILGRKSFTRAFKVAGGEGPVSDVAAFQYGDTIYLRRGSRSLVSDAVHEGTHALDELRGFSGTETQWEVRAYFAERRFQQVTGRRLDFPNWRDVYRHIRENY